jgi:putative hydrolase of the HAD superfamily
VKIKAVSFDVGGTLIEPWPSVGHVYAEIAAHHGLKSLSADQLNTRFKTAWRARQSFGHSRNEWEELVTEVFGGAIPPGFFAELYDHFAQPTAWHIYEDVLPALDELASRETKLAVISNWDERLRPLLHALRLDGYFEAFAISFEVGFPKPSRVIFEHAADKLGVPAAAILHIGDSLEMDVEGATSAGFCAVQIHRRSIGNPGIHSLGEIAAIIGKS